MLRSLIRQRALLATTQATPFSMIPIRQFSAEPDEKEKENARAEWGIKYDDECLKFEKEWKTISEKID